MQSCFCNPVFHFRLTNTYMYVYMWVSGCPYTFIWKQVAYLINPLLIDIWHITCNLNISVVLLVFIPFIAHFIIYLSISPFPFWIRHKRFYLGTEKPILYVYALQDILMQLGTNESCWLKHFSRVFMCFKPIMKHTYVF